MDATQAVVRRQVNQVQAVWRRLEAGTLAAGFRAVVAPSLASAISTGQVQAATLATPFVADTLSASGAGDVPPDTALVLPASFSGYTASGLPLESLATIVLDRMLTDVRAGMSTVEAMNRGLHRAVLYTATEVTDAGRMATQAQMIADTRVAGHERVVKVPACDRCIVLAGKLYRYSAGFLRHPRCDCTMRPVSTEQWRTGEPSNTPRTLFESMSEAEQDKRFGSDTAEAIRAGADISQVVNARTGMTSVNAFGRKVEATTYGTTVRGLYGGYEVQPDGSLRKRGDAELVKSGRYRRAKTPRLTAGQIVRMGEQYGWDRAELIRQLRRFAYLI